MMNNDKQTPPSWVQVPPSAPYSLFRRQPCFWFVFDKEFTRLVTRFYQIHNAQNPLLTPETAIKRNLNSSSEWSKSNDKFYTPVDFAGNERCTFVVRMDTVHEIFGMVS